MAANYSTNAQNPVNQSGGQPQGQVDPMAAQQRVGQPKTIRDYLAAARSQGTVPAFTNMPQGRGFMTNEPAPQAISEGPQNEYERLPFSQRLKIDPYIRVKERLKTLLPELWEMTFPGMDSGAILDESQWAQWQGAVEAVSGNLLKRFDKQYEWAMKNESRNREQRDKDKKYWHSKFIDAELANRPPLNKETGQPLTAQEFIQERMSIQDEMAFTEETEAKEREEAAKKQEVDFSPQSVGQVIRNNPELASKVKQAAMEAMQGITGYMPTEQEFDAWQSDPKWAYAMDQATEEALQKYREEIIQLMQQ